MRKNKIISFFLLFILNVFFMCNVVMADVIWPSIYIVEGMESIIVIASGFVMEVLCVKFFAKQKWIKSILISAVMNAISTIVGIILIPMSGILVEFILLPFDSGTFAISHWIFDYLMVVLCNVLIEGLVVNYIFNIKFKKAFWWLFCANLLSVIICVFSLIYNL